MDLVSSCRFLSVLAPPSHTLPLLLTPCPPSPTQSPNTTCLVCSNHLVLQSRLQPALLLRHLALQHAHQAGSLHTARNRQRLCAKAYNFMCGGGVEGGVGLRGAYEGSARGGQLPLVLWTTFRSPGAACATADPPPSPPLQQHEMTTTAPTHGRHLPPSEVVTHLQLVAPLRLGALPSLGLRLPQGLLQRVRARGHVLARARLVLCHGLDRLQGRVSHYRCCSVLLGSEYGR